MAELRERKKADAATKSAPVVEEPVKTSKSSGFVSTFSFLLIISGLIALALSISFVTTNTLTFGQDVQKLELYLPKEVLEVLKAGGGTGVKVYMLISLAWNHVDRSCYSLSLTSLAFRVLKRSLQRNSPNSMEVIPTNPSISPSSKCDGNY
jgi:hypothetical protein